LLQENSDPEQLQEMIEELNFKEENLEKELERTLELFKRMKFEYKLDEVIEETQSLEEQQEDLAEKNENKEGDTENLEKKQQELNESFEELEKDIEELQNLNQDLKNPELMQSTQEEQEEIKELQKEALEQMQKGKHKKSSQSQKDAAQKMRQMNQKMQQMQASMEMMQMQENLDDLRDILDNLLKLSFDEEELMKEFRKVNQTDPRFIELSQNQLKLRDDAQIVEDSLMSLAKRVFQISSFVTREVGDMNRNMDDAVEAIKERRKAVAVGKQQYVMTSINNLALLLDDVMNQMQQAMADAMGNPRPGDQKQQSLPSMIELQKRLSQQIQELKRSGKQGRQLSEELARMAAEQERLRKAMEEMNQKLKNQNRNGQGGLEDVIDKMEENEIDLVNKRLTENTIKRQQDILTRLLEAEKAMREQQLDKERKGETARDYSREIPEAFEEYIKQKEKEIELLKTIPPKLNPYYKEQVNQYFERLEK
jgi:DNA repair exonuclease SbcCD ATPase subunit